MASAALALVIVHTPLESLYARLLDMPVFGDSLLHWINDGLMAVFFLLVGLEIKRELVIGELSSWGARALPGFAALGGMLAPALVYVALNINSPDTLRGWAIPAATDIAFSLGLLALLGRRVPVSLKVFLTALAIIDDLGAVLIIAGFYTQDLSLPLLGAAVAVLALLAAMNLFGVTRLFPYLLGGAALWFLVLHSGVHATVAGVALGLIIPVGVQQTQSPLHRLEHALSPWVSFAVLPIFAFANAGVSFFGVSMAAMLGPIALGSAAGLFIGKQIGVFGGAFLAVAIGIAERPRDVTWTQLYGTAILCGVGFTMSLFIGLLAFDADSQQASAKLGVLVGSLLSGLLGWTVLRLARPASEG